MKNKTMRMALATGILAFWGLAILRAQTAGGFRFRGLLNRLVVPKNAGLNNAAVFCFDNPSDSGVSIKIFSLAGAQVANPQVGGGLADSTTPGNSSLCPLDSNNFVPGSARYGTWDGTSNGSIVHSGVYVYQIQAEGLTYTGTLVVVR
jgi:hypothetical protein